MSYTLDAVKSEILKIAIVVGPPRQQEEKLQEISLSQNASGKKGFCAGLRYHLNFSLKRKGLTSMCHCTGLTCNVSYMTATAFHGFHGVVFN